METATEKDLPGIIKEVKERAIRAINPVWNNLIFSLSFSFFPFLWLRHSTVLKSCNAQAFLAANSPFGDVSELRRTGRELFFSDHNP